MNSDATLENTLLSLRSQGSVNVRIIVVDSGSEDDTLEICRRWGVQTLYVPPGNMYRAINTGLRSCDTPWVAYLNSDDWLYNNALARLVAMGDKQKADIVYGDCDYCDYDGRFLFSFGAAEPNQLLPLFRRGVFGFAQQSAIFRKVVYDTLMGFDEKYSLSSDAHFYYRAALDGARFVHLDGSPTACFRLHAAQLSSVRASAMEDEKRSILAELHGRPSILDWVPFVKWRLTNAPHYAIRLLRLSTLAHKVVLRRSMRAPL